MGMVPVAGPTNVCVLTGAWFILVQWSADHPAKGLQKSSHGNHAYPRIIPPTTQPLEQFDTFRYISIDFDL